MQGTVTQQANKWDRGEWRLCLIGRCSLEDSLRVEIDEFPDLNRKHALFFSENLLSLDY